MTWHSLLNPYFVGAAGLWLVGAVAHSLPAPATTMPNPFYVFVYNFVQFAAANLTLSGWTKAK